MAEDDYFTGKGLSIDGLTDMVLCWREGMNKKNRPPESEYIQWVDAPIPTSPAAASNPHDRLYGYFQNRPKKKMTTPQRNRYAEELWNSFLPAIRIFYWHTITLRQILAVGRLINRNEAMLAGQISSGRFNNVLAPEEMFTQLHTAYCTQIGALYAATTAYLTEQHGSSDGLHPDVLRELEEMARRHKDHAIMPDHIRIIAGRQLLHRNVDLS